MYPIIHKLTFKNKHILINRENIITRKLKLFRQSEKSKTTKKHYLFQYNMHKSIKKISLTWSKYMILVLLLISEGSWLLLRTAEKATLELAARTEMPSGEDELFQSAGFESQTTRHLPSRTMGSVSFWAQTSSHMTARQKKRATQSTNALLKRFTDTMMNDLQRSQNPNGSPGPVTSRLLRVCARLRQTSVRTPAADLQITKRA